MEYRTSGAGRFGRQSAFLSRPRGRERAARGASAEEVVTPARHRRTRVAITPPPADGRSESAEDARTRATATLQQQIEQWIDHEGLRADVSSIEACPADDATAIWVRCSSRVKRRLMQKEFLTGKGFAVRAASA